MPEFLTIAPNNRIPAIVDHAPADGGAPIAMFESGAILLYLADKIGRFIPRDLRARLDCVQWLFWQMANLGPMAGQNHHFGLYAPEKTAVRDRPLRQARRAGCTRCSTSGSPTANSSPATIRSPTSRAIRGCCPSGRARTSDDFPHLKRWKEAIKARPATVRAYAQAKEINPAAGRHPHAKRRERSCSDRPRTS